MFFGTHSFEFDIHLENTGGYEKISNLITTLIYHDKSFDEYVTYKEKEFIGDIREEFYPPMIDEDGTEYFYRSYLNVNYSVEYYGDLYAIIKYFLYFYNSGAAHGNYWVEYSIIYLTEERILDADDLVNQIPDDLLKEILKIKYNVEYYLEENIWPPDTVNISNDNIELIWNTYSITPYSYGIIDINIHDTNIEQYLTDKGRMLKNSINGMLP
jgi:hypothetical protein